MLEELSQEGFAHINPSIAVWVPTDGDTIRGYILGRQFDRNDDPFYVVQLTRDWKPQPDDDDEQVLPAGAQVAVFETPHIGHCQRLLPNYQRVPTPTGEVQMAVYAYEVVLIAEDQSELGYADAIKVMALRINGSQAVPAVAPPPAAFTFPTMTKRALAKLQQSTIAMASRGVEVTAELIEKPSAEAPPNGA